MKDEQSHKIALALLKAVSAEDVNEVINSEPLFGVPGNWTPYGGSSKNWDRVGSQTSEAVGALGELIINSIDAILVKHAKNNNIDERSEQAPQSMVDAVKMFYSESYPDMKEGKISTLKASDRAKLATESVLIGIKRVRKSHKYPSYTIVDFGEGQNSGDFPDTFLSLGEKNKEGIPFVQGRFNMGSTGSITFCTQGDIRNKHYKLIMSRRSLKNSDGNWGWTLIRIREAKPGENLPVVEYFAPNGDIPKFSCNKVEAFGHSDIGIIKDGGTIVKLYEYDIGPSARNVDFGLYYALTTNLLECALPIRIYDFDAEKRRDKSNLRAEGIADRTFYGMPLIGFADNEKDDDYDLSTFLVSTWNHDFLGKIEILATGVKKLPDHMKEKNYPHRIFYTVNGQTQAKERASFFRTCNLDDLRAHLIVQVDCTAMNNTAKSSIFKPDRERISGNNISRELRDHVKNALKENSELEGYVQQIRNRRATDLIEENEEGKELWESLIKSDPEIGKLFGMGGDFGSSPSENRGRGANKFIGEEFPTFLNITHPNGDLNVPINTYRYIVCDTDADNRYLGRHKDKGTFWWDGDTKKIIYNTSLNNGTLRIRVNPSSETKIGDSVCVSFGFSDSNPNRSQPLKASVTVRFCEAEQKQSRKSGSASGTGPGTTQAFSRPKIDFVGKDEWDTYGFDDESGAVCRYEGKNKKYHIYVNADNKYLQRELKNEREESKRTLIREWFKLGVAILTLSMYKKFDDKTEDDDSWEENIKQASSAVSAHVVTLIRRLGGNK